MNVLVIGRGSIGSQHLKTLKSLAGKHDLAVHAFAPSGRRATYLAELKTHLREAQISAALVCNPTSLHVETSLECLRAGAHVFVEKPLSDGYDKGAFAEMKRLSTRRRLVVMVGYDMRFNPWIERIKTTIDRGTIGEIWGARVMAGQYLPSWRPGTDYTRGYSAKKALGGGVLLDLSHELDYLAWLLPKKVKRLRSVRIHTRRLAIETEDVCSVIIEYADRATAHVHLDYLTVPYRRSLELYGDAGTLVWDDNAKEVRIYTTASGKWTTRTVRSGLDAAGRVFRKELRHFFDCINRGATPLNSLENSIDLMRLIEAIR